MFEANKSKMKIYFVFINAFSISVAVDIIKIDIPAAVEVGSENIVLDCPFTYTEKEADNLEVKWYFNESPAPFFQWIAGIEDSPPMLIGNLFEDKLDLSYSASPDSQQRYRALLLHQPILEMSGTYSCKVSSLTSEDMAEANMLIYSPAKMIDFKQKRLAGSKVYLTCSVTGVSPIPLITLTWGSFDLIEDGIEVNPTISGYDVTIEKTIEHEELPAETVFGCEVSIPGTEYGVRQEAIYHYRGREEQERKQIKELEEKRMNKENDKVFFNTINRLSTNNVKHVYKSNGCQSSLVQPFWLICLLVGSNVKV